MLTALAMVALIVGVSAVAASDPKPPEPATLPVVNRLSTEPEFTKEEFDQLRDVAHAAWASHIPVAAGTSIRLPRDAHLDTLVFHLWRSVSSACPYSASKGSIHRPGR